VLFRSLRALEKDRDLQLLILLEGRRIRKEGQMILLTQGFLDFVRLLDEVLEEMRAAGQLRPDVPLDGVRSALMGGLEGLMRDQLLARRVGYPARYTSRELRGIFTALLNSFLVSARGAAPGGVRSSGA